MPRYVAFLRGVSPLNAKMPALRHCFEEAGYTNVRTVLSSGNVAFDARKASEAALQRKAEAAMQASLGRSFVTIVRRTDFLRELLQTDPYARFKIAPGAKRVVTFLRDPVAPETPLPAASAGARIVALTGREVFTAYVPGARGPVFMTLLEQTFGTAITTRTWATVTRCAAA